MLIAYQFLLDELAMQLQTYLIEKEAHWLRLHFNRIYQKSFQHNKLENLQNWCNDFVVKYPNKIFDSEEFFTLQENALVTLISRNDLQMEEVKIWNYIIKWGIAQNPGLPSDSEDWSHENFSSLKTTLQNCLPHIRYFQMSGKDIIINVQPYQQILEKKLWKDIMKKYMANEQIASTVLPPRIILKPKLPTRTVGSFSTVINEAHAAEIVSWIDKKDITYLAKYNPYEFKLLLRGSRDGFTNISFWNLCDKQTHLVIVIKVKGTDEILGGYNPIGWDKSITNEFFKECKDSFIFSLKNGNIQNSILSRVKEPKKAIYCGPAYGPVFGDDNFGLAMYYNFNNYHGCWTRQWSGYEKPIRNAEYFSTEEYEIFQIKKN
ncbi:hypothetical protein C2G38_305025 [Gigaspora rosea]|uniref:TLDc domain-containing protein n=1 Tax=Gigaspora rosea TaxID=44941 RepID=A0A397W1Q9_9GLOM|nr:hypothetical protein C2G38_305025 [Gigaspora rosea]